MLGFAALMALVVRPDLTVEFSLASRLGITAALGFGLGLVAAALLARNLAFGESWTVLLGTALVGIGVSMRLGLGALTVLFLAGSVISRVSHRHSELRKLLAPTERPLMLPVLLLAGASLNFTQTTPASLVLIAVVLLVRVSTKLGSGYLVSLAVPAERRRSLSTGAGLLSSGTLAMSIGSYCFLQLEQKLGDLVLICASLTILLGELASPLGIKRALRRAGELHEEEPGP
jgi:Kef-type K+ transport system membrane component KefB